MDSKVVNRAIKANVWPMLKEHGFGHFTTRTAWRHDHDRIDVINFQSFNSYQASVIGCTTYSFALRLGSQGLAWFRQFDEPCEVLRILTSEAERMGELWGFGNNPSPNRSYCTGYAALKTGQFGLAAQQL